MYEMIRDGFRFLIMGFIFLKPLPNGLVASKNCYDLEIDI